MIYILRYTSRAPPDTFFIPIIFSGNRSSNSITASTTILEKNSFWLAINFELNAVAAHFSNKFLISLNNKNDSQHKFGSMWESSAH